MANPFVRLLRGDKEVFDGGNIENEATFVSDYQLKGMIRHRVGRYDIKDETILTADTWEVFGIEKDWSIDFKLDKKSTKNNSYKYDIATFVSDYQLKGMIRHRVGRYDIKDETILTADTWEVFGIEKDWSIDFKLDKKSTKNNSYKYDINKSQTLAGTMEHKGKIVEIKNKLTVDNVTISPLGNLITITEEVDAPESDNLPYIGDRFVLLDEENNHLEVLSYSLQVPDKPNKPITSSYEFLLNNKDIKSMTLVPIEYENAMESKLLNLTPINKLPIEFEISKYGKVKIDNFEIGENQIRYSYKKENAMESKLLNLTPINKLPIEFEISKYGKVKIDNFEIGENQIRYSYKKEGIIPYLSDLIFCDENGEILFFENSFSKESVDRENNKVDVIINLETKKDKEIAKKIKNVTVYDDNGLKLMYDKKIDISLDK